MRKRTLYKKLKKENEKLKKDIYLLVAEPESEEAIILRMQYDIHFSIGKSLMQSLIDNVREFKRTGLKLKNEVLK